VRVAEYARQIAREIGLNPKLVDQIAQPLSSTTLGRYMRNLLPCSEKKAG